MSETMNPYAAPKAVVADVFIEKGGVQPVKLFSAKGRVGRLRYLAYSFSAYLLVVIVGGIGVGVARALGDTGFMAGIGAILLAGTYLVLIAFLTIQRSHDMDWSGWWSLLVLIPFVNFVWIFKSGTTGGNRFGAPPPPNTLLIKIGAFSFPALLVVAPILAAIALPAYQDYAKRAKASQIVKP